MSTSNEPTSGKVVVSTIEVRPSDLQKFATTSSTSSATNLSSTAPFVLPAGTTSASVVVQLDGQNAIRRANASLAGVQKVSANITSSSE